MTQENVADRLGVSPKAVSFWELGDSGPSDANKSALATLFGVSVDWLLGRDGSGSPLEPSVAYLAGGRMSEEEAHLAAEFINFLRSKNT